MDDDVPLDRDVESVGVPVGVGVPVFPVGVPALLSPGLFGVVAIGLIRVVIGQTKAQTIAVFSGKRRTINMNSGEKIATRTRLERVCFAMYRVGKKSGSRPQVSKSF